MSIKLEITSYPMVEAQKSAKQRRISCSVLGPTAAPDGKNNLFLGLWFGLNKLRPATSRHIIRDSFITAGPRSSLNS